MRAVSMDSMCCISLGIACVFGCQYFSLSLVFSFPGFRVLWVFRCANFAYLWFLLQLVFCWWSFFGGVTFALCWHAERLVGIILSYDGGSTTLSWFARHQVALAPETPYQDV